LKKVTKKIKIYSAFDFYTRNENDEEKIPSAINVHTYSKIKNAKNEQA
jgi:hypothetical protein